MIKETKDKEEKEILHAELEDAQQNVRSLAQDSLELLVPSAPYDKADDIILEFRPGAGGAESSIFVQDIS